MNKLIYSDNIEDIKLGIQIAMKYDEIKEFFDMPRTYKEGTYEGFSLISRVTDTDHENWGIAKRIDGNMWVLYFECGDINMVRLKKMTVEEFHKRYFQNQPFNQFLYESIVDIRE